MIGVKRNDKPMLLNLDKEIFDKITDVANEQCVTRTQFLRQSVERNLRHYDKNERFIFYEMSEEDFDKS